MLFGVSQVFYSIIDLIRVAKVHGVNDCMLLGFVCLNQCVKGALLKSLLLTQVGNL